MLTTISRRNLHFVWYLSVFLVSVAMVTARNVHISEWHGSMHDVID